MIVFLQRFRVLLHEGFELCHLNQADGTWHVLYSIYRGVALIAWAPGEYEYCSSLMKTISTDSIALHQRYEASGAESHLSLSSPWWRKKAARVTANNFFSRHVCMLSWPCSPVELPLLHHAALGRLALSFHKTLLSLLFGQQWLSLGCKLFDPQIVPGFVLLLGVYPTCSFWLFCWPLIPSEWVHRRSGAWQVFFWLDVLTSRPCWWRWFRVAQLGQFFLHPEYYTDAEFTNSKRKPDWSRHSWLCVENFSDALHATLSADMRPSEIQNIGWNDTSTRHSIKDTNNLLHTQEI